MWFLLDEVMKCSDPNSFFLCNYGEITLQGERLTEVLPGRLIQAGGKLVGACDQLRKFSISQRETVKQVPILRIISCVSCDSRIVLSGLA